MQEHHAPALEQPFLLHNKMDTQELMKSPQEGLGKQGGHGRGRKHNIINKTSTTAGKSSSSSTSAPPYKVKNRILSAPAAT